MARAAARKLLLRGPGRVGPGRGAETGCEGVSDPSSFDKTPGPLLTVDLAPFVADI